MTIIRRDPIYIFFSAKRYLSLPWEGYRPEGDAIRWATTERKTCGEGRRGRGNYVFKESGELPSTEELWISALAREMQVRRELPVPLLPSPPALRFSSVGFGGGRRDDSGHDGGKNKRRDVNEIKRVRGMYLRSG